MTTSGPSHRSAAHGLARSTDEFSPTTPTRPVFALPLDQAILVLDGDPTNGLSSDEVAKRLSIFGANTLPRPDPVPRWRLFLGQFADPVIYLLLAAIVVSAAVWLVDGAETFPLDVLVIALIVLLNAIVGFLQESKAEDAIAALRDLTQSEATVLRDGVSTRISSSGLVPGDVLQISDGDIVPADARVIEVAGLRVAEATLTGESEPVDKSTSPVEESAVLGDRSCMIYSGTTVVSGRGRALVAATATETEVGRIATLIEETEDEPTPLQTEIELVGKVLGIAVIVISVVVVATLVIVDGLRTSEELLAALLIGVSLAVAAVPEGLPAVLSVVLALGVQRMAKRNALIKRLVSVEALGSATIICSDKTGTLTRNEMIVRRVVVPSGHVELSGTGFGLGGAVIHDGVEVGRAAIEEELSFALARAALASDASVMTDESGAHAVGDPTEAALLAALPKAGVEHAVLVEQYERRAEIPFSAERKRMSTVVADQRDGGRLLLAVKGAPDGLLDRCGYERRDGEVCELTAERRKWWEDAVNELADSALRTLAIGYRPLPSDVSLDGLSDGVEDGLILVGVVGIIDPPREEATAAIAAAHHAGIRVAMITGDHPGTAQQIAIELGIAEEGERVITAAEVEAATEGELIQLVASASVYARVAPEHKLRIVNALTASGEVVAMTGDGVNDAPALRAANIGVAMGITGSDVSKDAADMILTDDNFATIVEAVEQGRAIFHNIRSFLRYLLSSNVGEVLTVFLGVVGASFIGLSADGDGLAAPLLAVQILWINLITDAAPALALGVDPPSTDLMDRRPRGVGDRVIDRRMQGGIVIVGLTMALATLAMLDLRLPGGFFDRPGDLETARTAAFTVLVLAQLFNTFAARSDTESAFGRFFLNRWLLWAVALSVVLQVCVVYLPMLNRAFGTVPLSANDWIVATVLASTVLWVTELRKWILRRQTPVEELD